jgi:hypothetical protein
MSRDDLERRLREARGTLPEPDASSTERARAEAVRAVRRRRPRRRALALVGTIAATLVLGIGVGSLVAPSTTASDGPAGLGFLPVDGWYVLQAGTDATPTHPAIAIASNVPLRTGDGRSIVPYETLSHLPENGIVIVANFTGRVEEVSYYGPYPTSAPFRHGNTRLVAGKATPIRYASQVRPEEPLGQYQLLAEVNGYAVDVHIYYGVPTPPAAQVAEAQRQLAEIVVRAPRTRKPAAAAAPSSPATTYDRTFSCAVLQNGGIYEVEARGHSGIREAGKRWKTLPFAVAATGNTGSAATQLDNSLAWITAGSPSTTTIIEEGSDFPLSVASVGTVAVNLRQCKAARVRVPLSPRGLRGGAAGQLGEVYDCESTRRVLIHVRARLSTGTLKQSRGFLRASAPVTQASLAMRTANGKPLMYATTSANGIARLFTARSCLPD